MNKGQDILDSLRRNDNAFYNDTKRCGDFLYFLLHQYFRTAKMKKAIGNIANYLPNHDPHRTANIINHIIATNVSVALFRERSAYQIIFFKNDTLIPFITGDQPVLNMLDPKATTNVELYYPLSPKLAVVLTKDTSRSLSCKRNITLFEVERYNYAVYSNSEDQTYSNNIAYLRKIASLGKNVL